VFIAAMHTQALIFIHWSYRLSYHEGTNWGFLKSSTLAVWWRQCQTLPLCPHSLILLFQQSVLHTDGTAMGSPLSSDFKLLHGELLRRWHSVGKPVSQLAGSIPWMTYSWSGLVQKGWIISPPQQHSSLHPLHHGYWVK
jgi:hypothetical protein